MQLSMLSSPTSGPAAKHPVRLMLAVIPSGDWSGEVPSASAEGYVLHQSEPHELLAAIHALIGGRVLRPERIAHKVSVRMLPEAASMPHLFVLSPRETEVLRGMVDGLSYKMVAAKLGISFETVRTHVKRVYEKLGVHNCTEAVAKALKSGLMH